MRTITSTIDLDAPPEDVWRILTDASGHARWNPFITNMAGTLVVGHKLDLQVVPPGGKAMRFRPTVTDVQPAHRLAWVGHLGFPGLFDGSRGVLVWMSRGLLTQTAAGFDAMHAVLAKEAREPRPTPTPT